MSRISLPHPASRNGTKLNTPLPDDYGELDMRADLAIRELSRPYARTAQIYEMLRHATRAWTPTGTSRTTPQWAN
jgi:hypothetical protein